MSSGSFKNVINKMETKPHQLHTNHLYLYKQDFVLNNLPRFICHKTQQTLFYAKFYSNSFLNRYVENMKLFDEA